MAKSENSRTAFDSEQQYLGSVYAKALLGAAEKANKTQAVLDEFDSLLSDVLDKLPKLDATLSSPRVPHPEKIRLLDKMFSGKMTTELLNFLKVVCEHGRFDCLRAINHAAHAIDNERRGRVEVQVRTAEPVDVATASMIGTRLQQLLGREVDMKTATDPTLLGGMVVRVGDTVYDGSLANRLTRLRKEAVAKTTQEIRQALDRFVTT